MDYSRNTSSVLYLYCRNPRKQCYSAACVESIQGTKDAGVPPVDIRDSDSWNTVHHFANDRLWAVVAKRSEYEGLRCGTIFVHHFRVARIARVWRGSGFADHIYQGLHLAGTELQSGDHRTGQYILAFCRSLVDLFVCIFFVDIVKLSREGE